MRDMIASRKLRLVISCAVCTCSTSAYAGYVPPNENRIVYGSDAPPDRWNVDEGGRLALEAGAEAFGVSLRSSILNAADSRIDEDLGDGIYASGASFITLNRSTVRSRRASGLTMTGERGMGPGIARATSIDSAIVGSEFGARIMGGSMLSVRGTTIRADSADGVGASVEWGSLSLNPGTVVRGEAIGLSMVATPGGMNVVDADNAQIKSGSGAAVDVQGVQEGGTPARLILSGGSVVTSDSGPAIHVRNGAKLATVGSGSSVLGDIVVESGAVAEVDLKDGAQLLGKTKGDIDLSLATGARWTIRGESNVRSLELDGGGLEFVAREARGSTLTVKGDMSGSNSAVFMAAHVSPALTWSDRIVVEGDVVGDGAVKLNVAVSGAGVGTDTNGDGLVNGDEGLSLVHVTGKSRADAFELAGGSVVAGAYQYTLHPFTTEGTDSGWDYRLANKYIDDTGVSPEDPAPPAPGEDPAPPGAGVRPKPVVRPAVAPEIASYLSASSAVIGYARAMSSGLHQRLGDIRDGDFSDNLGGEVFARYVGTKERYRSNLGFTQYGYDFDQSTEAMQFGGGVVALDGDNGSLRAGWAYDHGRTTVTPRAVDGQSVTRLRGNGVSMWSTWKHGSGAWLDAVVSQRRLRGTTDTSLSGRAVGSINARVGELSLEVGVPVALSEAVALEPHVRATYQSVTMGRIRQQNDVAVSVGKAGYTTYLAGATLSRRDERFSPFVRLDISNTVGSGAPVKVSSSSSSRPVTFASGTPGREYSVAGGFVSQLTAGLSVYGEGSYSHYLRGNGFSGWSGQMGFRLSF